ncbi:MAG: hypothetical protein CEN87_180 [Parcubacteria group bacterium Licking1014_1]|nr:MAG: hypothetical protein CEN87_180 [Parcubacteria group bacterium Licking1014_1]
MKPTKKEKQIFWDYDLNKINLSNPKIMVWYLSRKLRFGDLSRITKKELKKHLPKLDVSPSLKELLNNFLKINV